MMDKTRSEELKIGASRVWDSRVRRSVRYWLCLGPI